MIPVSFHKVSCRVFFQHTYICVFATLAEYRKNCKNREYIEVNYN